MVGRQTPLLALFVPLILVFIVDRKHGIRDTWPAAVVCGVAFAIVQFVAANYISVPLTDILASLLSAGAVVLLLRVWQPARTYVDERPRSRSRSAAASPPPSAPVRPTAAPTAPPRDGDTATGDDVPPGTVRATTSRSAPASGRAASRTCPTAAPRSPGRTRRT